MHWVWEVVVPKSQQYTEAMQPLVDQCLNYVALGGTVCTPREVQGGAPPRCVQLGTARKQPVSHLMVVPTLDQEGENKGVAEGNICLDVCYSGTMD